ncbi:phage major capsid protein [Bacillus phage BCPST]|uniref:Phage major capsid protein n=1 Tax=Bacillus phage BCPST TaxID=2801506 RepID=A0AAE7P6Y4_9CAUD|nr:phage major capsid protein [Bacillus phage BCPST]QQO38635.1 phage major capsid protein [Bacillus phage BCPST]QSJ04225.1 major capsid protein [Bacillus phage BCP6]
MEYNNIYEKIDAVYQKSIIKINTATTHSIVRPDILVISEDVWKELLDYHRRVGNILRTFKGIPISVLVNGTDVIKFANYKVEEW